MCVNQSHQLLCCNTNQLSVQLKACEKSEKQFTTSAVIAMTDRNLRMLRWPFSQDVQWYETETCICRNCDRRDKQHGAKRWANVFLLSEPSLLQHASLPCYLETHMNQICNTFWETMIWFSESVWNSAQPRPLIIIRLILCWWQTWLDIHSVILQTYTLLPEMVNTV